MTRHTELPFRQVHLDFHTSGEIPGIGQEFDKSRWQECLQIGHVNSITCFSCCHHGWSYHPTKVGVMHPGLNMNLLRAEIDACHEIGVSVPIYLTAGLNNVMAEQEPGWREISPAGNWAGWVPSPLQPGFKKLCFNSPYLDYLCQLIEEAATLFPDADGMFFDIISQGQCCCPACLRDMRKEGYDPQCAEDRERFSRRTLKKYMEKATAAARCIHPDWPVFHNNSNLLQPGQRDFLPFYSHLELESLPTGGWGYDHFPLLAAYCRTVDKEFLGMTGKFHTTWGEFGGFKTAQALRYECCAMLAQGAKCSIGDQLHPSGLLDKSTYDLIGQAYAEVEKKEPWCRGAQHIASVGILSNAACGDKSSEATYSEIGLSRLLLEAHIPFDRLDDQGDFTKYKALILPDTIRADAVLRHKLDAYSSNGGKLILSGDSLLKKESDELAFPLPVADHGIGDKFPDYIVASPVLDCSVRSPFVMYRPSRHITVNDGESLGEIYEPYFNRTYEHFSSHQHAPYTPVPSGYQSGVLTDRFLYFAHPVFKLYALYGAVLLKEYIVKAIKRLLDGDLFIQTTLPSQGRISLLEQKCEHRYVVHVLYASPILRGMSAPDFKHVRGTHPIEVIEELNPLYNITLTFTNLPHAIRRITLQPQDQDIPFKLKDGVITMVLDKLICHQLLVLQY